jgi:hypothetical protein
MSHLRARVTVVIHQNRQEIRPSGGSQIEPIKVVFRQLLVLCQIFQKPILSRLGVRQLLQHLFLLEGKSLDQVHIPFDSSEPPAVFVEFSPQG